MPLQNRVTPFGQLAALPGRGLMMGNRGILHDDDRQIVRAWQVRRWIACLLRFRGRHRDVMQPHRYTELFFLDEAAAFAAGHRPCAECRNADYRRFQSLWKMQYGGSTADEIDRRLHDARLSGGAQRIHRDEIAALPDGAYVALDGAAWLIWHDSLHRWGDSGYAEHRPRPARSAVDVLTPEPLLRIFSAGYRPSVHPSAASG